MRKRLVSTAVALTIAGLSASLTAQRVLLVPSQYATIQAAIDTAVNADTVLVSPGRYLERIDFKGKSIRVIGRDGPRVTTIDAGQRGSVVTFRGGEGPTTRLEGFAITGGLAVNGGGIHCTNASPTVAYNHVRNNQARQLNGTSTGGGILCQGGSPTIVGNLIQDNSVYVFNGQATGSGFAYGGGLGLQNSTANILNNVIAHNSTYGGGWFSGASRGGGLSAAGGSITVTGNTIVSNACSYWSLSYAGGGGIFNFGAMIVTNSIVRGNTAQLSPSQIFGSLNLTVNHSDVEGGYGGSNNIDADPRFVDVPARDYHIRYDSPCRDTGTQTAPGLPASDFEGDPRQHLGNVDIGADEFHEHLYYTGKASPGQSYSVKIVGSPGSPVIWGYSLAVLRSPAVIPGLNGKLHLDPSSIEIVILFPLPPTGIISFSIPLGPGVPLVSVPMQALIGLGFTNVEMVHVVR